MDFAFNEEQEQLRSATRRFLEKRHPLVATRRSLESGDAFDRDAWREAASLGITAPLVPDEHGGGSVTGQPLVDLVVVAEETGRVLYPGPFLATNVVAHAVGAAGSESHQSEILPRLARGDVVATWCFTEDGTCDPAAVGASVERRGAELRLDGVARFVPDAHVADLLLVTARDGEALAQFLVPLPNERVTVRVLHGLDLTRKLCEVRFDGVTVSTADRLGAFEDLLDRQSEVAAVLLSAESVGAAERVLEMTVEYAKVRVQFGRPIGSFQAIKHKLADMLISLETCRAAAHYAALAVEERLPDAAEAVSTAKSHIGDRVSALCGEAVQIHGGIGFTWEHDMHLYLRRAKSNQVLFGDPAWHRERLCTLTGF
jgi:alkylation response protein AidB-like acyl-CoA dehydrogenase